MFSGLLLTLTSMFLKNHKLNTTTIGHTTLQTPKTYDFNLEYDQFMCPYPAVKVTLNKKPYRFVVDFGTRGPDLYVTRKVIQELHITKSRLEAPNTEVNVVLEMLNNRVPNGKRLIKKDARMVRIDKLDSHLNRLNYGGIMSADFFHNFSTTFNYRDHFLKLTELADSPMEKNDGDVEFQPLFVRDGYLVTEFLSAKSNRSIPFIIDTGSPSTILGRNHILNDYVVENSSLSLTDGYPMDYESRLFDIESFSVGRSITKHMKVHIKRDREKYPLIGNDIISKFELTFDQVFGNLTLRLLHNESTITKQFFVDIAIKKYSNVAKIMYVRPDSEASKYGIAPGDILYSVNGYDCTKYTEFELNGSLVRGYGNSRTLVYKSQTSGKQHFILHD